MITTTGLANTFITLHNCHFLCVVRTFKTYSLATFKYIRQCQLQSPHGTWDPHTSSIYYWKSALLVRQGLPPIPMSNSSNTFFFFFNKIPSLLDCLLTFTKSWLYLSGSIFGLSFVPVMDVSSESATSHHLNHWGLKVHLKNQIVCFLQMYFSFVL